ncbi:phosphotransferase, partial [Deinococcus sp. HMF7604]|uniref:phosphotransferase n=1 Tax=Deinococcus betulae TaxID=2873312 RepID=UPI001CCB3096
MSSSPPRRLTTLHLLLTAPGDDRVAHHTLCMNTMTYYGEHVPDAARAAGVQGTLGRRLAFTAQGEVEGVRRSECVWHLHSAAPLGTEAKRPADQPEALRPWAEAALSAHTPARAPWFQAGWQEGALAWLDEELAAQELTRTAAPQVLKHWQISLLWRVPTDRGKVYFKAVPSFFAREVSATPVLAREVPGAAPPVLAADQERGFLLLADSGEAEPGDLTGVMQHLAAVQRASLPLLPALELRDRGPAYLRAWLPRLLSDETLLTGQDGGFTPQEAALLRARQAELDAALLRLAASPLPLTLGHGDLHSGNVTAHGAQVTLLDWSDICR